MNPPVHPSMPPRPIAALLLVLPIAAACGDRPVAARATARDLVLEPAADLSDGSAPILARPWTVFETDGGAFVIADVSDNDIKRYAATGERQGVMGRRGRGPGEFTALQSAQPYRDSLVAYDFSGATLSVFAPDGRHARSLPLRRGRVFPNDIRVVDDSLLLAAMVPLGGHGGELLRLLRPDGAVVASMLDASAYFGGDLVLAENTGIVADARGGVVFAALTGADSLWAFDYRGRRLAATALDPVEPLVSLRALLAENGGRLERGDGYVNHLQRNVIGLVALDGGLVVLHVAPYDTRQGTDPIEGGTLLAYALSDGALAYVGRAEVEAGLFGRGADGRALLLGYASPDGDRYRLHRLSLREAR